LPTPARAAAVVALAFCVASCEGTPLTTLPSPVPVALPVPSTPPPPSPPAAVSLTVAGERTIRGRHATASLEATVAYADGTTVDRTAEAAWTSSDASVATVDPAGVVTTHAFGSTRIDATLAGVTGALDVSVVPVTIEFTATSQGRPAFPPSCGGAVLRRDGTTFYSDHGCAVGSARGWNVAAIDLASGDLLEPVRNFDLWYAGAPAATALIDYLVRQRPGTLLAIAVGDEAGITVGRSSGCPSNPRPGSVCCRPLGGEFERLRETLEGLGAREIRSYCYWNSYSLMTVVGAGAVSEQLGKATEAVARYTLSLP
jgi:hypothetical protein